MTVYLYRYMDGGYLHERDIEDHHAKHFDVEHKKSPCPKCGESMGGWYNTSYNGNCYKCDAGAVARRTEELRAKAGDGLAESIRVGVHAGYRQQDVDKHKIDMIQPYHDGEFSNEFKEAYPEQTASMVRDGAITQKQVDKAKDVWH